MKKFIIDRFEGVFAVCEDENQAFINIPKYKLPLEIKEGDCLKLDEDGIFRIDRDYTKDKKDQIREKINRLFE